MSKRWRSEEEECFEVFGALLRQSCSRAVERLSLSRRQTNQLHRQDGQQQQQHNSTGRDGGRYNPRNRGDHNNNNNNNNSTTVKPIDILVIQFCLYYLPVTSFPEKHFIRLSAEIVTGCIERVLSPARFAQHPASLAALCESLVLEHSADEIQDSIKVIEEFVEAREGMAAWLEEYEGEEEGEHQEGVELAGMLYRCTEYWTRVHSFCVALSVEGAQGTTYVLRGRYEKELMEILHSLTTSRMWDSTPYPGLESHNTLKSVKKEEPADKKEKEEGRVKAEEEGGTTTTEEAISAALWENGESSPSLNNNNNNNNDKEVQELPPEKEALSTAVLGDTLALSHCAQALQSMASTNASEEIRRRLSGLDAEFYAMVHARLGVMVTRYWITRFSTQAVLRPPPLNVLQQRTLEEVQALRPAPTASPTLGGVSLDFTPDDHYFEQQLQQDDVVLGEDEELYKEEVEDYYLRRAAPSGATASPSDAVVPASAPSRVPRPPSQPQRLLKPHRYVKVKTGFTWNQYNRAHYTRSDPPPRTVLWYEFTLRYPLLANTKKDMRRIFRIENTPKGPGDDYCLIVFSVGPPYVDVAYRIVRKQWDTRPGGVRISFDSTGKYRLFFRFTNSNYRR